VTRAPDGQLTLHTSILLKHVETTWNNIKIHQTYQADAPEKGWNCSHSLSVFWHVLILVQVFQFILLGWNLKAP
jgi:hypothetical protein